MLLRVMEQVFVGTSGYSFKEWKGNFYPAKLPDKQFLTYYAERLATVELNNTFYRTPTVEAIAGWCNAVPSHFRFSVKAPQRITHVSRLKDMEPVRHFAGLVSGFGERLGVVLFQFPPQFRFDFDRLRAFRDTWPRHVPTALEFRNVSWDNPEVRTWMREEGLAWVVNDGDESTMASEGEHAETADRAPALAVESAALDTTALDTAVGNGLVYLRLRRAVYTQAQLASWAHALNAATASRGFVFFKHEVQGPAYAATLRRLIDVG